MHGGFGFGMGMGWMWIWPLVFLAVAAYVIRAVVAPSRPHDGAQAPEDILKKRFARGEIDEDEYTKRLEKLRK